MAGAEYAGVRIYSTVRVFFKYYHFSRLTRLISNASRRDGDESSQSVEGVESRSEREFDRSSRVSSLAVAEEVTRGDERPPAGFSLLVSRIVRAIL